jgi:hypothetical protein
LLLLSTTTTATSTRIHLFLIKIFCSLIQMPVNTPKPTAISSSRRSSLRAVGSLQPVDDNVPGSAPAPTPNTASYKAMSPRGSTTSMETAESARRGSRHKLVQASTFKPSNNGKVSPVPLPAPVTWLEEKKKYKYVWQCCACGYPSIRYRERSCPSCSHDRCDECVLTKVLVS